MLVKNLVENDIFFQYGTKDQHGNEVFELVNIIAGWVVDIPDVTWEKLKLQTKLVREFSEEEIDIDGVVVTQINTGERSSPTRLVRQYLGTSKRINLIKDLIRTRQIELVEQDEIELPKREVLTSYLNRFNFKVLESHTDQQLFDEAKAIKEEIEALSI